MSGPARALGGLLLTAAVLLAAAELARALTAGPAGFPHETHARLFPLCEGCHVGVETGDEAAFYPPASTCAVCHDGVRGDSVVWDGPARRATNLRFSHPRHDTVVADAGEAASCESCHTAPGAPRMAVQPAAPEDCTLCHAHRPADPGPDPHLAAGQPCGACHLPVWRATDLPLERVLAFPRPPSHDAPGFVASHDPVVATVQASCATCHTRESCARCHLDADRVPAIVALGSDARVAARSAGLAPAYPVPSTHEGASWPWAHGPPAAGGDACATCHTRADCRTCHLEGETGTPVAGALSGLTEAVHDDPRGVRLQPRATGVHEPGFVTGHGASAATAEAACASCHVQAFCVTCHDGPTSPGFHLPDYAAVHAADAYGRDADCASCHDAQVFCRSCHEEAGLASGGGLGTAFHTANPFWLLGHGTAARQGLEGCVTCHAQSDCVACHGVVGGWGINPHGPGFDPVRAREANPFGCTPCHGSAIPGLPE